MIQFLTFLCFIFAVALAYFSVGGAVKQIRSPSERRPPRQTDAGSRMFWFQLQLLLVLGGVGFMEGWSLRDVGVSTVTSPIVAFMAGVACYLVFILIYGWTVTILGVEDKLLESTFEVIRVSWPRDPNQKLLYCFSAGLLNPFTEEVVFRGVLIFALGEEIDSTAIAVGIGLTLSLLAHAYQGALAMPGQFLFHGLAVVLLLSRFGLVACISFHLVGDLYPMMQQRQIVRQWAVRRRSRGNEDEHAS